MTTLHITVGDREQLREDTLQFVQDVEADDLDDQDGKATLQFGTYDDFVDSLTPLRLELIRAIAEEAPESMREAARLVDRDVSDVHSDLKQLEVLSILTLEEGGPAVRSNLSSHSTASRSTSTTRSSIAATPTAPPRVRSRFGLNWSDSQRSIRTLQ